MVWMMYAAITFVNLHLVGVWELRMMAHYWSKYISDNNVNRLHEEWQNNILKHLGLSEEKVSVAPMSWSWLSCSSVWLHGWQSSFSAETAATLKVNYYNIIRYNVYSVSLQVDGGGYQYCMDAREGSSLPSYLTTYSLHHCHVTDILYTL